MVHATPPSAALRQAAVSKIDGGITVRQLAGLIAEQLRRCRIDAVLSGGALVSIYSANRYQSWDLDFVTSAGLKELENALRPLGFTRDADGRHFSHPNVEFLVEFPSGPLMVGHEHVTEVETIATRHGPISVLSPTDSIKDRLAAFFHWNDRQSLDQAKMIARLHPVNLDNIRQWAAQETQDTMKLDTVLKGLEAAVKQRLAKRRPGGAK